MKQDVIKTEEGEWYEDSGSDDIGYSFKEYDITSTPNDFNTKTIIDFIESGLFKIPGFQRNYVWDLKRASKLIESIIIGLPIPQVFLYEENKNNYLVIDGQQRLLTLYFFFKKRFPKKEKRFELRRIFTEREKFPDEVLRNDEYFEDFKLRFDKMSDNRENKLHGRDYSTLEEFKTNFDLRTVRNIMIRQNSPTDDDSAMFEIFNRLNSGGVILKPQEIRISLYHSDFYNSLYKLNSDTNWRTLLNKKEPDVYMKDIEILLRGFAMLLDYENYSPSMTRFLNQFSKKTRNMNSDELVYYEDLFRTFCEKIACLDEKMFISKSGKFSITFFESIFTALCIDALEGKNLNIKNINKDAIDLLKSNPDFISASQDNTAGKSNVALRLKIAKETIDKTVCHVENN